MFYKSQLFHSDFLKFRKEGSSVLELPGLWSLGTEKRFISASVNNSSSQGLALLFQRVSVPPFALVLLL